jgi:hypothetical protein
MLNTAQDTLTIPVDREHSAMRLTVVLIFIAVWILSFIILSTVIPNEGLSLLAVLGGFAIAYGTTALTERFLKTRWPSGRAIQIDREGVKMVLKGKVQGEILAEDPANALLWTFKIAKRARVPKGWSMLACSLEFESQYLAVYTFMSPAQLGEYPGADQFKVLAGKRKGKEDAREDLRMAGEQRRLHEAENNRWLFGAEMTPPDFIKYVTRIKAQFPEWMPVN